MGHEAFSGTHCAVPTIQCPPPKHPKHRQVRLNLFVIMLLVEATGEPNYVLPISIGVMFAVWVGDRINHGIYHRLMDLASFPFLSNSPTIGQVRAVTGGNGR